jgi:hypothetical protein
VLAPTGTSCPAFDFYEAIAGNIHKLSGRAARGEVPDDSDVSDLLVDLDDRSDDEQPSQATGTGGGSVVQSTIRPETSAAGSSESSSGG